MRDTTNLESAFTDEGTPDILGLTVGEEIKGSARSAERDRSGTPSTRSQSPEPEVLEQPPVPLSIEQSTLLEFPFPSSQLPPVVCPKPFFILTQVPVSLPVVIVSVWPSSPGHFMSIDDGVAALGMLHPPRSAVLTQLWSAHLALASFPRRSDRT